MSQKNVCLLHNHHAATEQQVTPPIYFRKFAAFLSDFQRRFSQICHIDNHRKNQQPSSILVIDVNPFFYTSWEST